MNYWKYNYAVRIKILSLFFLESASRYRSRYYIGIHKVCIIQLHLVN
jgi:hypothetical protein